MKRKRNKKIAKALTSLSAAAAGLKVLESLFADVDDFDRIGEVIYKMIHARSLKESIAKAVYWPTEIEDQSRDEWLPLLSAEQRAMVDRITVEIRQSICFDLTSNLDPAIPTVGRGEFRNENDLTTRVCAGCEGEPSLIGDDRLAYCQKCFDEN